MAADEITRRLAAMGTCRRILPGVRPTTMRAQLAGLDTGVDLDGLPDRYGDGGLLPLLEEQAAALLGTHTAVWMPTGTMAQQVALRVWAEHTGSPAVAMHPRGHLEVHEGQAYAALTGLRAVWP